MNDKSIGVSIVPRGLMIIMGHRMDNAWYSRYGLHHSTVGTGKQFQGSIQHDDDDDEAVTQISMCSNRWQQGGREK